MWPVNPGNITLRVCADLNWRVMVHCPGCRYSVGVNTAKLAATKIGGVALDRLLEQGVFVCRTRCAGVMADGIDVTCMDVGLSKTVAEWKVSWPNGPLEKGCAKLVKSELPQGGSAL